MVRSTSDDIGVAIAGVGLGAALLQINRETDTRMRVRALYDPQPERIYQRYEVGKELSSLADEFGIDAIADSYEDLIGRDDVDVVAVFSPCPFHHAQVLAALEAGKHVIVTKPLAVSVDQAREMVEAVDRTGLKLLVGQSMRFNSQFLAIRELFEAGDLGEIILAEGYYIHDLRSVYDRSPWRWQMPQDLMYGGVCHPVDLLRWFLGEAEEVFAYGSHGGLDDRYPADKANNFIISIRYRSGVTARVLGLFDLIEPPTLWAGTKSSVGIGLFGTRASVLDDRIVREYYPEGSPREERIEPSGSALGHHGEVLGMLRHFEECIVRDLKPLIDVRDGAQVTAVCEACWRSIESGQPEQVTREFDR